MENDSLSSLMSKSPVFGGSTKSFLGDALSRCQSPELQRHGSLG
jgi:hypothetical protein